MGRDSQSLSFWDFLLRNWEPLLAYLTAMFGVVGYFISRSTDRAWRRTEFLFQQMHYLDNDGDIREAIAVMDGRHSKVKVQDIFGSGGSLDGATRHGYMNKFDKLLNLLQSLQYAVFKTKTLSAGEMYPFGWYIQKIVEEPLLLQYCRDNGFDDIDRLAKCIDVEVAATAPPLDAQPSQNTG